MSKKADILERLRNYIPGENDDAIADRITEAADEIEKLRSVLDRLVTVADQLIPAGGSNAELADAEDAIMAAYRALGRNPTQSPIST